MLNLFRSLFVIVALGCGAVLFNNDSNRLVLRPIERMLRKVCFLTNGILLNKLSLPVPLRMMPCCRS